MHQEKAYIETKQFNIISYDYALDVNLFDDFK